MKKKCARWQSAEGYVAEILGGMLALILIASCSTIFWPVIEMWVSFNDVLTSFAKQV